MTLDVTEHIHLYWVVENEKDLYLQNLCRAWSDAFERFTYTTIVATRMDAIAKLANYLSQQTQNVGETQFYLAGQKSELAQTKNALLQQGVNETSVFTEVMT
jgi:CDP-4-dehydro-6-deoxyglucose reductase